ncbi:MAG: hypothetical protein P4L53_23765 [Candidatus Obscuribacterales bacterium]|nr:hypothetical protein [Candidatus Obscuribacterales bacterium]
MTKSKKIAINYELAAPDFDQPHTHCSTQGMFGGSSFFVGGGKENYAFMPLNQLVANALEVADSEGYQLPTVRLTKNNHYEIDVTVLRHFDAKPMGVPTPKVIRFIKAKAPTKKVTNERRIGHMIAGVMIDDMFAQPVHTFFERDYNTLVTDKHLLSPEYFEIADSLRDQLLPAQSQVIAALPQVMQELRNRYADASTGQLYQAALQLIGQQLAPILSTIQIWTTGFRQSLDPALKDKLRIVRAIVTSNLFLALTGNLKLDEIGTKGEIKQLIPTINVSVGDVVLPVLIGAFDSGPAVMPMASGALGPRGGHIAFIPWNLLKLLPLIIGIYAHETGHLLQAVIKGYMQTYGKLSADTIMKAAADGTLVFDEEFVMLGEQKIPSATFWAMVFMNQLPEQDADNWGMRATGAWCFIISFALYLAAMTEVAVGDMDHVDHVLRMGSSYSIVKTKEGKLQIRLEPHPQDGPRIGSWQAAIADLMNYPQAGAYARAFAASESGTPTPTRMTWVGQVPKGDDQDDDSLVDSKTTAKKPASKAKAPASKTKVPAKAKAPAKKKTPAKPAGKTQADEAKTNGQPKAAPKPAPKQPQLPTLSASVADYDKCCKLVVKAHLETPTDCLNGMTLQELVNLTPKMHEKVDDVRAKLRAGDGKLSPDYHTFFLTVGAAFCEELKDQVDAGGDPTKVFDALNAPAMEMLLAITEQWEADVKRLDVYKLNAQDVQPKTMKKS